MHCMTNWSRLFPDIWSKWCSNFWRSRYSLHSVWIQPMICYGQPSMQNFTEMDKSGFGLFLHFSSITWQQSVLITNKIISKLMNLHVFRILSRECLFIVQPKYVFIVVIFQYTFNEDMSKVYSIWSIECLHWA